LSESQLVDLTNELLAQRVALRNQLVGGHDPHIKIMLEWSLAQKHKKVIKHETMVHHSFLRPISFKSIYTMKEWKEVEFVKDYNY
jgi:hypothetical protein